MAKYELLIDGREPLEGELGGRRARVARASTREEHAQDDPDATHVQIRRLSALVVADGREARRAAAVPRRSLVLALAFAAPAQAALKPGDKAAIDVSVATLWKAPNLYRSIDRPSVTNPVDPVQWSDNLSTTASRVWLDSHVQTQALYGADGDGARACSGGWAKVAVRDEPDPQDAHGYPGWLPVSQLRDGLRRRRAELGRRRAHGGRCASTAGGRSTLSYGTQLPVIVTASTGTRWSCARPTAPARSLAAALAPSLHLLGRVDRRAGEALPRRALPLGRPLGVGLRLLRASSGTSTARTA